MKPYQLVILILAAAFIGAALLAGLAKPLLDYLITHFDYLGLHVHWRIDPGTYNFGKVYRRMVTGIGLIMLILLRRRLHLADLALGGLRPRPGAARRLFLGTAVGAAAMLSVLAIAISTGNHPLRPAEELPTALEAGSATLLFAPIALLAGVVEETIFQGFILGAFLEGLPAVGAAMATSALFAFVHFIGGAFMLPVGTDLLAGFRALGATITFGIRPDLLPAFLGLFLAGLILAAARVRSGSLHLSIGIHAGLILALKGVSLFYTNLSMSNRWPMLQEARVALPSLAVLVVTLLLVLLVGRKAGQAVATNKA